MVGYDMNTNIKNLILPAVLAVGLAGSVGCDKSEHARNQPDQGRTAGQELDDKTLAANVKAALMADTLKYPDVNVLSYKGIVQLSGFVDAKDQKERAGDIATKVTGVSKIENNITIKDKKP